MNVLRNFPNQSRRVTMTWNSIKHNWLINVVHKFTFILFFLSIGFLVLRWHLLPPLVPLWYTRPWGTDQLAHPVWLLMLPLASLIIYCVNFLISMYVTAEYLIFTQMLFLTSLIISLLSFIALIKIIFLIT